MHATSAQADSTALNSAQHQRNLSASTLKLSATMRNLSASMLNLSASTLNLSTIMLNVCAIALLACATAHQPVIVVFAIVIGVSSAQVWHLWSVNCSFACLLPPLTA